MCGLAALLALSAAACGSVPGANGAPTRVAVNETVSAYTPEGAVRLSDGAIRWKADLGAAPPVFGNGVLYATTVRDFWPFVSAVRVSDGKVLWGIPEHARVGPLAADGSRLVIPLALNGALTLTALDGTSGAVLWRSKPISIDEPVALDVTPPMMSQPVFAAGNVLVLASSAPNSSYAFAWNIASGTLAWRTALPDAGPEGGAYGTLWSTGDTVTAAYRGQAANGQPVVVGLDPATGSLRWPQDRSAGSVDSVSAQVVVVSDGVARRVTGLRTSDGSALWQWLAPPSSHYDPVELLAATDTALFYRTFDDYSPGPISLSQTAKPHFWAVSIATGKVMWQRVLPTDNPEMGWMAVAGDGTLLYQHLMLSQPKDKQWVLLALDASTGATKWQQMAGTEYLQMLVRTDVALATTASQASGCTLDVWAIDTSTGARIWHSAFQSCAPRRLSGVWIVVR